VVSGSESDSCSNSRLVNDVLVSPVWTNTNAVFDEIDYAGLPV